MRKAGQKAAGKRLRGAAAAATIALPRAIKVDPLLASRSSVLVEAQHTEAMRAVVNNNVQLLREVQQSARHEAWLYASLNPSAGALVAAPVAVALGSRNKNRLKHQRVITALRAIVRERNEARTALRRRRPDDQAELVSLFEGVSSAATRHQGPYVPSADKDAPAVTIATKAARLNQSLMLRTYSGTGSKSTYGHHVRQVASGRGGRELLNAFTTPLQTMDLTDESLLFTEAGATLCWEAIRKSSADPATTSDSLNLLEWNELHDARFLSSLGLKNNIQWLKKIVAYLAEKSRSKFGPLHLVALTASSASRIPASVSSPSIRKQGEALITPFHFACLNSSTAVLAEMLRRDRAAFFVLDAFKNTAAHYAAANPKPACLSLLLERCPVSLLAVNAHGETPLTISCRLNLHENVAILLESSRSNLLELQHLLFPVGSKARSPLHDAATNNAAETVRVILNFARSIDASRSIRCARTTHGTDDENDLVGDRSWVERLLTLKPAKYDGITPIHAACNMGNLRVVEVLVDENAQNINVKDRKGRTPFVCAAKAGDLPLVSFLASRGAKTNVPDSSSNQAIHYAAAYGHLSLLKYLVEDCNADPNAEGAWKMTPIGLAVTKGYGSTCGQYLMSLNTGMEVPRVNVNFRNADGQTLLAQIVSTAKPDATPLTLAQFEHYLSIGLDPSLTDAHGNNILHLIGRSTAGPIRRGTLQLWRAMLERRQASASNIDDSRESDPRRTSRRRYTRKHRGRSSDQAADSEDRLTPFAFDAMRAQEEVLDDQIGSLAYDGVATRIPQEIVRVDDELTRPDVEVSMATLVLNVSTALLSAVNDCGHTPLHVAAGCGNLKLFELYLRHGADPGVVDATDQNALHHLFAGLRVTASLPDMAELTALMGGKQSTIAAMLTATDRDGMTPIHRLFESMVALSLAVGDTEGKSRLDDQVSRWIQSIARHADADVRAALLAQVGEVRVDSLADSRTNQHPQLPAPLQPPPSIPEWPSAFGPNPDFPFVPKSIPALPLVPQSRFLYCGGYTAIHFAALTLSDFPLVFNALSTYEGAERGWTTRDAWGRTPMHLLAMRPLKGDRIALLRGPNVAGLAHSDELRDINQVTPLMCAASSEDAALAAFMLEFTAPGAKLAADSVGRTALHRAAARHHDDLVRLLSARYPADVNRGDAAGRTPLHYAVACQKGGSIESSGTQRNLVAAGADPSLCCSAKRNAFHYCFCDPNSAVIPGDPLDTLSALWSSLKAKPGSSAQLNVVNEAGNTPVLLAVKAGAFGCALTLASWGSDLMIADANGNHVIAAAMLHGAKDLVVALLQSPTISERIDFNAPLHIPKGLASEEKLREAALDRGLSIMFFAMIKQWTGVVQVLLNAGYPVHRAVADALRIDLPAFVSSIVARVEPKSVSAVLAQTFEDGSNLLHVACACPSIGTEHLAFFVDQVNIPVNAVDAAGRTPAHYHNAFNCRVVLGFLASRGLDLNTKDNSNSNCLSASFPHEQRQVSPTEVEHLRLQMEQFKVSPDTKVALRASLIDDEPQYVTPLAWAIITSNAAVRTLLLDRSASITLTDDRGRNALHHCARIGDVEAMEQLLASVPETCRRASLEVQDMAGKTPLLHAVMHNRTSMVQFLSRAVLSSDLTTRGDTKVVGDPAFGRSLLHWAVQPTPYCSFENAAVVRALLPLIDPAQRDRRGETPSDLAAKQASGVLSGVLPPPPNGRPLKASTGPDNTHHWVRPATSLSDEQMVELARAALKRHQPEAEGTTTTVELAVDPVLFSSNRQLRHSSVHIVEWRSVLLTKVDVEYGRYGKNVFYVLQLAHDKQRDMYVLWTRWGGVGEDGQYQATPFSDPVVARRQFESIFTSKTGEKWTDVQPIASLTIDQRQAAGKYFIHNSPVLKKASKDQEADLLRPLTIQAVSAAPSRLPTEIFTAFHRLINAACNHAKDTRREFDATLLPLGRIGPALLTEALGVATQIVDAMSEVSILRAKSARDGETSTQLRSIGEKVTALTNRLWTLVPHPGLSQPWKVISSECPRNVRLPNSNEDAERFVSRIASLRDLDVSTRVALMANECARRDVSVNPVDIIFDACSVAVSRVEPPAHCDHPPQTEEEAIFGYVTRNLPSDCAIDYILRLQRSHEDRSDSGNMLLFHGSLAGNVISILREGLLSAPPLSPNTSGGLYGPGIYFSDTVEKALRYTDSFESKVRGTDMAPHEAPRKYVFLCSVSLGDAPKEVRPTGCATANGATAVIGIGKTTPDPTQDVVSSRDGLRIPSGKVVKTQLQDPNATPPVLQENQFVVYERGRVAVKFLVCLKHKKD